MFEIYPGKNGEFYFRLKANNGQSILSSEGYKAKTSCMNGIDSVKRHAVDKDNFVKQTAANGKFFFSLKASNGQVIGSSQMYESASGCDNGIDSVMRHAPDAEVKELPAD